VSVVSTPRITPFLWFESNAAEAAAFYVSIFPNSRMVTEFRNPQSPQKPLVVAFDLDGQRITALNGGPAYKLSPAISFVVSCHNQEEIDSYWSKLSEGGMESQCGWLTDRFGLSWQVVPANISELLSHPRAMQAMMGMKKLIIADLKAAAQG
jgi:predicted 3-demethylubiquinone-9 3-methyltransferase (glyoxalase superfamily)